MTRFRAAPVFSGRRRPRPGRVRSFAGVLAIVGLVLQALVPVGQAVTLPSSGLPLVICTQFGARTVVPDTDPREDRRSGPTGASCVVCQALSFSGLDAKPQGTPLAAVWVAADPPPPARAFVPVASQFLMRISARPPPAGA